MRLPISCSMCGDARVVEAYCVTCSGGTYTLTDLDEAKAEAGKLRDILRDVWNQFAVEKPDGTKWHGGLSTLKDVESALQEGPVKKELGTTEELEFYTDQGDGFCYKCRRGYSECQCNRFTVEDAIANLGAELHMLTNNMSSRRTEPVLTAFRALESAYKEASK